MSRIYKNLSQALNEAKRDVVEMGILVRTHSMQDKNVFDNPEYETLEVQNYSYTVTNPVSADIRDLTNQPWADDEFTERVGKMPLNPGLAWQKRPEIWKEFLHNGKFSYTYSERMAKGLPETLQLLRGDLSTRQAYLAIWNPNLDNPRRGGISRVPCSLGYLFQVRDGKLNMTYTMRSCDAVTHFTNDVYLATKLLEYAATKIGVKPGTLTHIIGSFHIYRKDADGVF